MRTQEVDQTPRIDYPSRRFVSAMLECAVRDLHLKSKKPAEANISRDAYVWLTEEPEQPDYYFTARACCEILGVDYNGMREKVIKGIPPSAVGRKVDE